MPHSPNPLPLPSAQELTVSRDLCRQIGAEIAQQGGWIRFDRFMELALYCPGLGYYSNPLIKFGAAGDFVTAPLLGNTLARAVAAQFRQWEKAAALPARLIEFGAGTGQLAADLLRLLDSDPARTTALEYWIVELSADLVARQRATLSQQVPQALSRVRWLQELPERFDGVVIGNEVLDAMPARCWRADGASGARGWTEMGVSAQADGAFVWQGRPADATLAMALEGLEANLGRRFSEGYSSEINLSAQAWISEIGRRLGRGAVLLIDYGFDADQFYAEQRSQGTLMCHYRHRAHDNPFWFPGLQDLTTHVDFSSIWAAGTAAGLELLGYVSQANFLMNCDALEACDHDDALIRARHSQHLFQLTSESEMGELFKVIAFAKGAEPLFDTAALGFTRGDRSGWL